MSGPMTFVADTNVLMDMMKADGAPDVPAHELQAAKRILLTLLENRLLLGYAKKMTIEWTDKGLFNDEMIVRLLLDQNLLKPIEPRRLNGGQRDALARFVDRDDQVFVLTAAEIDADRKTLATRDPKTVQQPSRAYVKRTLNVVILLATEFVQKFC